MNHHCSCWSLFAALLVLPFTSVALPTLRITDGNVVVTVTDNGAGDGSSTIGFINYTSPANTFPGWSAVSVSFITKPVIGNSLNMELDMTWSITRNGAGSNSLTLLVSEIGFNMAVATNALLAMGGTLGTTTNSAVVRAHYAGNNVELNRASPMTARLLSGPGGFSVGSYSRIPADSAISFTLGLDLTQAIGQVTSGDVHLYLSATSPPPVAPKIFGLQTLADGTPRFSFTNKPGLPFTILSATNLSQRLSNWTAEGIPLEINNGQYQFTAAPPTNNAPRFFGVRSP